MDELIIIKPHISLRPQIQKRLYDDILAQREKGLIIVPAWCEVIRAPKDIEVRVGCLKDFEKEIENGTENGN